MKDPKNYIFNTNEIARIDYMAPGLVGPEKTRIGKLPTDTWWWSNIGKKGMYNSDVWWMTIVGTNSRERIGYPTQKPTDLIDRIVLASSLQGDTVLDFFAGSGTIGESCLKNNRKFILVDNNLQSIEVMSQRFHDQKNIKWIGVDTESSREFKKIKKPYKYIENKNSTEIFSPEFKNLIKITSNFQGDYDEKSDMWRNSPFEWIMHLPARSKGKIARAILIKWLSNEEILLVRERGMNENLIINNKRFAVKYSSLWADGIYQFQQIRADGPDFVICFGISPFDAHCWVFNKEKAIENGSIQHRGAYGSEYWLKINPSKEESWAKNYGGTLSSALNIINSLK